MVAADILGFQIFVFLMKLSNFNYSLGYAAQIAAMQSIHAEVISILVYPRWMPSPSLNFKFSNFRYNFPIDVIHGDMQFNLQPNSQIDP